MTAGLVLIGILVLVFAIREAVFLIRRRGCKVRTEGTVKSLRESRRGRYGSFFTPSVSYFHGETLYREETCHGYRYDVYAVNQPVALAYDPEEPSLFLLERERRDAVRELILMGLVLVLVIVGLFYARAAERRDAEREEIIRGHVEEVIYGEYRDTGVTP